MIQKTISDSAFLVNESRARSEALSLDIHAKLWVDQPVRELWQRFNDEVYDEDPRALAVRNRFFLEQLNLFFKDHPNGAFINIAAGFTSYPYLVDQPVKTIEIDLPRVTAYKKNKVKEFIAAGDLPCRDITWIPADLNRPEDREDLFTELERLTAGQPSFILLEGISYYLAPGIFLSCMAQAARIQRPSSQVALDYWEPDVENNRVFSRFCDFLDRRCGHPRRRYNLMTPADMATLEGYTVHKETDVSAYEQKIARKPVLQEWENRLPENFVVLTRT
ncbi:MAG: class I SAM-dependent methyltransferase [Desulfobacter sp.]|nr:MAG: class I SAM-dependent methyltransferase [Desulfobacter sp.]